MPICKKCSQPFPVTQVIDGRLRVFTTRKYCLTCSPFGRHNTRQLERQRIPVTRNCQVCQVTYEGGHGQYAKTCKSCRVSSQRRNIKKLAVEQLGGCCQACGYRLCLTGLQFHHRNPHEKDFTIADMNKDWSAVREELKKCVLLCALCHVEVHAGIWDIEHLPTPDEVWARRLEA